MGSGLQPGGLQESSRGLSAQRDTPGRQEPKTRTLKGCQQYSATLSGSIYFGLLVRGSALRFDPRLLSCSPSGCQKTMTNSCSLYSSLCLCRFRLNACMRQFPENHCQCQC